jgi:hypothetical protein
VLLGKRGVSVPLAAAMMLATMRATLAFTLSNAGIWTKIRENTQFWLHFEALQLTPI